MYGLEKGETPFHFDLEEEIKDTKKSEKIFSTLKLHIQGIKEALKEGSKNEKEQEKLGTLLQGYLALEKVLTKASKK